MTVAAQDGRKSWEVEWSPSTVLTLRTAVLSLWLVAPTGVTYLTPSISDICIPIHDSS